MKTKNDPDYIKSFYKNRKSKNYYPPYYSKLSCSILFNNYYKNGYNCVDVLLG